MNQNPMPVDVKTSGRKIIVEYNQDVSDQAIYALQNQLKEFTEVIQLKLEQNSDEIQNVKRTIESKYISPDQLNALQSLVDKKARKFVNDKKGIQLNIDVFLNYDPEGLANLQKLVNKEVGKTKQKIWVELNKKCLDRKGTDPKNEILDTQVEAAFDFVRTWGGFTV